MLGSQETYTRDSFDSRGFAPLRGVAACSCSGHSSTGAYCKCAEEHEEASSEGEEGGESDPTRPSARREDADLADRLYAEMVEAVTAWRNHLGCMGEVDLERCRTCVLVHGGGEDGDEEIVNVEI